MHQRFGGCYLEGQPTERFTILTDHNPLLYLPNKPTLSRRMARWSEYLQRFTFQWTYRPGNYMLQIRFPEGLKVRRLRVLTRSLRASMSSTLAEPMIIKMNRQPMVQLHLSSQISKAMQLTPGLQLQSISTRCVKTKGCGGTIMPLSFLHFRA